MSDPDKKPGHGDSLAEKVSGFGQSVIGEIELLAGVINADPLAQAEGEYNVEVGELRDELEEQLPDAEHSDLPDSEDES